MNAARVTLAFAFTVLLVLAAPSWRDVAYAVALAAGFVGVWTAWQEPKQGRKPAKQRKPKPAQPEPGTPLPLTGGEP